MDSNKNDLFFVTQELEMGLNLHLWSEEPSFMCAYERMSVHMYKGDRKRVCSFDENIELHHKKHHRE